jgi:Uma2 family endonuclease
MTTDEYLGTPETRLPQELVYGVVRDAPAPSPGHQDFVGRLHLTLAGHVERHLVGRLWLSPIDVVLDRARHLVVQPDLIVVSYPRLHIVTDRVWGAPDLVIEVLSPHPRIGTLEERLRWFADYGVRECWLVHQFAEQVEVLTFDDGRMARRLFQRDEPIASVVLPDFRESLASILGPTSDGSRDVSDLDFEL